MFLYFPSTSERFVSIDALLKFHLVCSTKCRKEHPSSHKLKSQQTSVAMLNLNQRQAVIASILTYSLCSGSLVLLNKLTLHFLPFSSLVICFQLFACILLIYGAAFIGVIDVDPIKWECVKPYMLYILFFCTGIYCNMRSLAISNVETVIVFRALCPMLVAFLDALFLGREWPSLRSWAGLSTLLVGAIGYASYDEKFQTQGLQAYAWPSAYCIIIALEMVSFD